MKRLILRVVLSKQICRLFQSFGYQMRRFRHHRIASLTEYVVVMNRIRVELTILQYNKFFQKQLKLKLMS